MSGRHVALVVEDDAESALDLHRILDSLACDSVVVDNKTDALEAIKSRSFCLALLDLEIREVHGHGVPGSVTHGRELLREVRRLHPERIGTCFRLPLLVVSAYAREVPEAMEVVRDGATYIVQKPLSIRGLSEVVLRELERSGRASHAACASGSDSASAPGTMAPHSNGRTVLSIPGDREKRRVRVAINGRAVAITEGNLKTLLRLMVAHVGGGAAHKRDLGATNEQGFRGISNLRADLKPVVPSDMGVRLIGNDYHGNYQLHAQVEIGDCNIENLIALDEPHITALANNLKPALTRRKKSGRVRR